MRAFGSATLLTLVVAFIGPASAQTVFLDQIFNVQVDNNIQFGTGITGVGIPSGPASTGLFLDVYRPAEIASPSSLPAVLLIHGGGFYGGNRNQMAFLAQDFASRGYVALTIDYRTYDEGIADETSQLTSGFNPFAVFSSLPDVVPKSMGFSAAILDTVKALDWLQVNAANYDIDLDKVLIAGGSAGARVALAVGLAERSDQVAGVISLLGSIDHNESLVSLSDPPFVLFNGVNDPLVDYSFALALADAAQAFDIPFGFYSGNNGHDATDFFLPNANGSSPFDASLAFFYEQLDLGQTTFSVVPEASSVTMISLGVGGLLCYAWRRARKSTPAH